jgi:hypothetical protein
MSLAAAGNGTGRQGAGPGNGGRGGEEDTLSFEEALEKIETRFIYNLPETELSHIERLFFQIEQAHWFYEVATHHFHFS